MSLEILGLMLLGALLTTIFVGFPISFTLILLGSVFGYIGFGDRVFDLMIFQTVGMMKEETFAAVPLFIFMGHLMEEAGLMERLFKSFQYVLGGLRGSLFVGVLFTATIFATATGIIGASVTVMGLLAAPAMMKSKYDVAMSAGVITAGGCLGILIPPSVLLVVLGPVLGVSVLSLFLAAIVPGFILSCLYIIYTIIRCQINPELGPAVSMDDRPDTKWKIIKELLTGIIPIGVVIFAALGSIIAGLATPTEAAAMAAVGSLFLIVVYRKLTFTVLKNSVLKCLSTSSMVLFLAVASNAFGAVFSRLGTADLITKSMLGLPVSPFMMILILMAVIFILGWPLEWPAIVFIFLPIFLPVVTALDLTVWGYPIASPMGLVWFGTLVAVNLQTAYLSPPVAMAAYYLKGVAPEWSLGKIYNGMIQFMILQCICLIIVLLWPQIVLWLPKMMQY